MKLVLNSLLAAVIVVVTSHACEAAEEPAVPPSQGSCLAQQAKPDPEGAGAEAAALKFVHALNARDAASALSQMTASNRTSISQAQIEGLAGELQALAPVGELTVAKAYILSLNPTPTGTIQVPCLAPGPNRGMDFVTAGTAPNEAHVLLTTSTKYEGVVTYSLWLWAEDGNWRVAGIHADPSMMAGKSGFDWWEIAKQQRKEGHDFNAFLMYETARSLLNRGPYFQAAGLVQLIQEEQSLTPPAEFGGPPPRTWPLSGQNFTVLGAAPTGVPGGKSILPIIQQAEFTTETDAENRNHQLIDAINRAHPEWKEVFNMLGSRTCRPSDSRCFGTVYDRDTGYLTAPPPP